jgi:hypothetical protein
MYSLGDGALYKQVGWSRDAHKEYSKTEYLSA